MRGQPHVLVLVRSFPNTALPTQGVWAERMVRAATATARVTVISPVPYVPAFVRARGFARFRAIPPLVESDIARVHHPRVLTGPGLSLHSFEARLMEVAIRRLVARIHDRDPVDLIHAHFVYPEGVAAARLGRKFDIPVITTEHAHWLPWLDTHRAVRRQVLAAIPHIRMITGVSPAVCDGIRAVADRRAAVEWLPNVLDDETFRSPTPEDHVDPDQLLFVGIVRRVKGLDVLVRALAQLASANPRLRLRVIGEPYHRGYRRDEYAVRQLITSLQLDDRVVFAGQASPEAVASEMRRSALIVVPSRRESFSSVTIEALASGTPVIATRCGGPEYLIGPEMGTLVPIEDPAALASAIADMLARRHAIDRARLRAHAVDRFGMAESRLRLKKLYERALSDETPAEG